MIVRAIPVNACRRHGEDSFLASTAQDRHLEVLSNVLSMVSQLQVLKGSFSR